MSSATSTANDPVPQNRLIYVGSQSLAPNGGAVIVDGQAIDGPSLDRAVIFQGHALMPWMTAEANVAFALSCRHRDWGRDRFLAPPR